MRDQSYAESKHELTGQEFLCHILFNSTYESTARLMPPDNQSASTLALMAGAAGDRLSWLASDALGLKSTGGLFIGILQSRTVQDRLVSRFDLRRVYGVSSWKDARERLA